MTVDPQAAAQRPTAKPALEFNHEYVLGEPETTDCPAGGQPVESADECGVAAKKLGKMYLGEQNPAEMDPKGPGGRRLHRVIQALGALDQRLLAPNEAVGRRPSGSCP
ncbi:unnamed protein product [Durusdinium trenchii]|uniref:Uncharacterized protein n=1 Tax=Durusdinium trenchii TaxID=1381693 RepID=A0ABP0Q0V6_9DINO